MYISIIIPAYNEEERLKITLDKVHAYLNNKGYQYEVIVIDDGSTDKTEEVILASSLYKAGRMKFLKNTKNKGKGFSVRRGILTAKGERILFTDADLSTPIEELDKLLSCLGSGYDIAIGSRSIEGADVKVHQPFYREYMGKFFNILVQTFALKGFVDTQCGFKLFRQHVIKDILTLLKIDGFAFDVEMLYLAQKRGYKIKEIPVIWINSPKSRVNPIIDSWSMFVELLSIKRLHAQD